MKLGFLLCLIRNGFYSCQSQVILHFVKESIMSKLDDILTEILAKAIKQENCAHRWKPMSRRNKYVGSKCQLCKKTRYATVKGNKNAKR